jgi:hypothetical protein
LYQFILLNNGANRGDIRINANIDFTLQDIVFLEVTG